MGATLTPHTETLVRIARAAGEVVMRHYQAGVDARVKSDRSPVTDADEEAEKLILMTNEPGVHDRSGRLAYVLTASEAERLLADGTVGEDMRPRVSAALQAVREGVRSVHIIDGGVPSALLLEVLTAQGVGTAVRSDTGPHFLEDSRGYLFSDPAVT